MRVGNRLNAHGIMLWRTLTHIRTQTHNKPAFYLCKVYFGTTSKFSNVLELKSLLNTRLGCTSRDLSAPTSVLYVPEVAGVVITLILRGATRRACRRPRMPYDNRKNCALPFR